MDFACGLFPKMYQANDSDAQTDSLEEEGFVSPVNVFIQMSVARSTSRIQNWGATIVLNAFDTLAFFSHSALASAAVPGWSCQ